MSRRIETQAPLAQITERGVFGEGGVGQLFCACRGAIRYNGNEFRWAISWPGGWTALVRFSDKVMVPAHVLVRFLDKEAVLLNIETERYFGLDETGARMWQLATTAANIDAAYQTLLGEYDVDGETLREHLSELLEKLANNGLLTMTPSDVGTTSTI
jgi:hypothetical protein